LASNDEIDAAFASVGYGSEKIEECRNAVALAKREGARPSDWQISDEAARQVAATFAACRAAPDAIARLRQFLRCYVGTGVEIKFRLRDGVAIPRHRRDVVPVPASARWRGGSRRITR